MINLETKTLNLILFL